MLGWRVSEVLLGPTVQCWCGRIRFSLHGLKDLNIHGRIFEEEAEKGRTLSRIAEITCEASR